jgi:hypothetical protein
MSLSGAVNADTTAFMRPKPHLNQALGCDDGGRRIDSNPGLKIAMATACSMAQTADSEVSEAQRSRRCS